VEIAAGSVHSEEIECMILPEELKTIHANNLKQQEEEISTLKKGLDEAYWRSYSVSSTRKRCLAWVSKLICNGSGNESRKNQIDDSGERGGPEAGDCRDEQAWEEQGAESKRQS